MEILQSELKIENLIKEVEYIYERLMNLDEVIFNDTSKIESKLEKMNTDLKEYIENAFKKEEASDRKYLISYLRKPDTQSSSLKEIENIVYSNLNDLNEAIKNLKNDLNNKKNALYKLKDLERDINSMKEVIEKDVLLNIELNRQNAPEKVEYVYDLPPQLINSLNDAFQNICIAKDGMDRMKVYEDIVNNLENFQ
ncbi:MAG: Exonuclease SbcC [Thermoanaerobacterium thermosaccharolyticum]|jgi:DNA repair exonuclease SbcCD ATPase subunit